MWVINQSKTCKYKVDLTNPVEKVCCNFTECPVQDRVLAKSKGLSKHSDKSQMWSQLFVLSILLMPPKPLVGFLLGVFFIPPFYKFKVKSVWLLVPGTVACFPLNNCKPVWKTKQHLWDGVFIWTTFSHCIECGLTFKETPEHCSSDESTNCFWLTWFTWKQPAH